MSRASSIRVGFFGLGAMGFPIAANLAKKFQVYVWNRSIDKASKHAQEHGTCIVNSFAMCGDMDYILTCLPTSLHVSELVDRMLPHVSPNTTFIDITSGDLTSSKKLSDRLKLHRYMDAPVSGGPAGALRGSLTSMVGSQLPLTAKDRSVINAYSAKIVECGGVGHGNAIKGANNFLNVTHLLLATDVLVQLKKAGVSTTTALDAINASSGRSLQTEVRIPEEVMSRRFGYGFKLNLMRKDVLQSQEVLRDCLFYEDVRALLTPHAEDDNDYTSIVRDIEQRNDMHLP